MVLDWKRKSPGIDSLGGRWQAECAGITGISTSSKSYIMLPPYLSLEAAISPAVI